MKYEIINEYNYQEDYSYLESVINKTADKLNIENAYVDIIFTSDEKMQELNKMYRNIDATTDVLSFALEDNGFNNKESRLLGDIYVSIPKMEAQALEYRHSKKRELSFLVCHGLLHLLGYDHTISEEEEIRQFKLQDEILNDLNIIM